jgi:hypothetical protein
VILKFAYSGVWRRVFVRYITCNLLQGTLIKDEYLSFSFSFLFLFFFFSPCSRVPLEKLACSQLVKKFPAFCGTRRFIPAFTNARHLSLPWARSIQSMPPHLTYIISILTGNKHEPFTFDRIHPVVSFKSSKRHYQTNMTWCSQKKPHVSDQIIHHQAKYRLKFQVNCNSYTWFLL